MKRYKKILSFIFLILFSASSFALNDQVTHLPGLQKIQNKQYAGYAHLAHHKKLFYWFVQSHQKNAPIILWSNGGPGYSSMYGFFNETGPYKVTSSLQLIPRKHAWNHFANYLIIDQPEDVGLSDIRKNPCEKSQKQIINDYYHALRWFLVHHKQYQHRAIYLAGESYAGTYLPLLANKIVTANKNSKEKINLKGLILVSPWADPLTQQSMDSRYAFSHGFISAKQKKQIDLIYKHCAQLIHAKNYDKANSVCSDIGNRIQKISQLPDLANIAYTQLDTNKTLDKYMNQKSLLTAIHAQDAKKFKCFSNTVNDDFIDDIQRSIRKIYGKLLRKHIPILIFSGLNDMKDTNFLGEKAFIHKIKWSGKKAFFRQNARPVIIKTKTGALTLGYANTADGLTWVKVLNAGHMVPKDQPRIDSIVKKFIQQK